MMYLTVKRIYRRPAAMLILLAAFLLLTVLISYVQEAMQKRQGDIDALARNTEVWCVLSDRATGRTDQLQVSYAYAQGPYYENAFGLRDEMKTVRIVTHMDEVQLADSLQPVAFVAVNSKDAWAPIRTSRVSMTGDWTEDFLDGVVEACIISGDLSAACTDGSIRLQMPDGTARRIPVAGTIADRERTVIVPWQVYRDEYAQLGRYGQSLDEFSFLVADNTRLAPLCAALENIFATDNAIGEASRELLLIQDMQYQQNMLYAKRNLAVVRLIAPILLLSVLFCGWCVTYLLFRVRSWEQVLLVSLGYRRFDVIAASLLEVGLSCTLGWLAAMCFTPLPVARVLPILCAFLLGAAVSIAYQVHQPILQQIKKKEA